MTADNTPQSACWYRDGLQFACTRCHRCCGGAPGYIWVTGGEIARMAEAIGMDIESFHSEHVRRVGTLLSLKEKGRGFCVMHSDTGCRVYTCRPAQCVAYPFWSSLLSSPEAWRDEARKCPGMNRGRRHRLETIRRKIWNNL